MAFTGIPVQPAQGSKRSRYPDVRYEATFFTQGHVGNFIELPQPIRAVATADASGVGRDTSDIIQCSTYKGIGNPVGTWSVTLVPRQDYLSQINPGDWCEIKGDNGDGLGMRVLCYGPIKSVDLSRSVSDRGITRTMIQVSGSDFGETLVKTSAILDAQLANEPGIASIAFASIVAPPTAAGKKLRKVNGPANPANPGSDPQPPPGTPGAIVKALLKYYLTRTFRQLIDPQTSQPFAQSLNLDYIDEGNTLGKVVPSDINPSTSLWQLLQQWANLGVNELFADYRPSFTNPGSLTELVPSVILRQCPFWGQSWEHLPTVSVESDEVMELQMGKNDGDVRNWIRPLDEGNTKQYLTENIGVINPESIQRFGFRRYENPTAFVLPATAPDSFVGPPSAEVGGIGSILKATAALQALWHHSNEKLLNGSVVLCFRPEIRVGYKLAYKDLDTGTQYEFYVEGVQHSFSYPGASSTHLTLTRGRDIADPLWRKPISALKADGILDELGNTVSATYAGAIHGLTS